MGPVSETLRAKKLLRRLPRRALTNLELLRYSERAGLPNFRGVFMRDELKSMKPWKNEMGVLNLDSSAGLGTHWVAYSKKGGLCKFFDSFGLRPPLEVQKYFTGSRLLYSNERVQRFDASNCGQLCLDFLIKESENI